MRILPLLILLIGLLLAHIPQMGLAQGAGSLFLPEAQETPQASDDIAEIMRQAAENGVSVVVIDSDGNLMAGGPPPVVDEPAQAPSMEGSVVMKAQDGAVQFRNALIDRLLQLPAAVNEVTYILRASSPDGTISAFGWALVYSLLLFGVGMIAQQEIYGKRLVKRFVVSRIEAHPKGYSEKMPFLVFRYLVGVGGILFSMVVAYLLGIAIFGPLEDTAMQFTVTLINIGYFVTRLMAQTWRMILSPYLPQYRIPKFGDRDARRLHHWLWILATFDVVAILFGVWIAELGLNYDFYAFGTSLLSAIIVLANILMVLVNRKAITGALLNGRTLSESNVVLRVLARLWMPLVIGYVVIAWGVLTYDLVLGTPGSIPLIAGAYGILMTIIVVYGVINYLIERGFSRARAVREMNEIQAQEEAQEAALAEAARVGDDALEVQRLEGALEETRAAEEEMRASMGVGTGMHSFEALARRVAGILAFVAGTYAFLTIWDSDNARMVDSIADQVLDVMAVLFLGYILYHAFRIWIDTKIREESADQPEAELGDEGGGSSASRLATLLPLFRNFVLIVVVVTITLIVLMQLGINVGPLFAGAGIVGVAVGFGSQALVRDIFAGAFFLFDDAFRKGEYLDVGGVKGTVEKISVRSFQLRHHLGALHTIPFGELQVMTNYSRDWVIMKLPLRVTYETDVEKVRKLIKKLGQELLDDPVIGADFMQPLKSQGVIEMQDSAMIIRVKFMTKPGDQWMIRKRVYEEIRALFEREGINFAHREVTVRLADGKAEDLTPDERRAVTAAARASVEEDMLEDAAGALSDER
ncbi:MAG: mechanosensitive ion channel family protein [Pseudomonadota bacterium]